MSNPDQRERYLDAWRRALRGLLDWPEQVTEDWSHKWDEFLDDEHDRSVFYHETPIYYIAPLLIPGRLRHRLSGRQLRRLCDALQVDIEASFDPAFVRCDGDERERWAHVRASVDGILRRAESQTEEGEGENGPDEGDILTP